MDEETIKKVKTRIEDIADENSIQIEKIVFFGSRTREDYTEQSDIDIMLISSDFEGTKWYKRGGKFQREWDYDKLPTPEIICLTPEEHQERKNKLGDIVKTATEQGITI